MLVVPGEPLVTSGPYQFISHPNYLAVVGEIASVAAIVWAPDHRRARGDRVRLAYDLAHENRRPCSGPSAMASRAVARSA